MKNKLLKILICVLGIAILVIPFSNKNLNAVATNETVMVRVTLYGNFTITNAEGKYFKWDYEDMEESGNMPVTNVRVGGTKPLMLSFDTENSPSFTYKSKAKKSDFSIVGSYYGSIEATNASSSTISNDNKITSTSVTGKNVSYSMGIVANNNGKVGVDVIGKKSNGTVTMKDTKNGVIVTGASGITKIIKDRYESKEKTINIIPYASPVTITNLKRTPKIKNAKKITKKTYKNYGLYAYQQQDTSIRLSWNPVKKAKGYIIYKYNYKTKKYYKKKTVSGQYMTLWVDRNLKENTVSNYKVKAYFSKGKKGKLSYYVSATTKSATKNNVNKIEPNKKSVKGKVGKKIKMKAKVSTTSGKKVYNKSVRWYTGNKKIATVTRNGKLVLKSKGTTYILGKAHNGKNIKVKVVVK